MKVWLLHSWLNEVGNNNNNNNGNSEELERSRAEAAQEICRRMVKNPQSIVTNVVKLW